MSAEDTLCDLMHYPRAILFPRARDAIAAWCKINQTKIKIPTNCCAALLPFASELVPIDPDTGLAPVPVQLYGYRQTFLSAELEIDPLMTGLMGEPFANSTVVSFGYAKTIDIGGGGAILTRDTSLANELERFAFFPKILRAPLAIALGSIHFIITRKKAEYEEIEATFRRHVWPLPERPVIPWRYVAKIRNSKIFDIAHEFRDIKISRNYPPLPGVTDAGAIAWGDRVINIWK